MELNEDNKEKLFNYFEQGELEQWYTTYLKTY
jgi:hypothetical protein